MRALETDGYAEIVSAPRIVCRTGKTASLTTTTDLPIQTATVVSNRTDITTGFTAVGVTLKVTPEVVGRDAITCHITAEVSNVVRFEVNEAAGGLPVPVVAKRSADTQVDVRNGELLVIGGLLDKQRRNDVRKVPLIGSIPFLGRLFASEDDLEQKTQIVFLLRIRILTSAEKALGRAKIPLTREERVRQAESAPEDE